MRWYEYPRVDNYGAYPDPFGNYPKPDSNIECPPGVPVTAIAPGTVSGIEIPSWAGGEYSVTIRLDTPINKLATHMAYNFIESVPVSIGTHVSTGDQLGVSGSKFGFGLAFALTNDDIYGTATFTQYDGNPLLNPVPVLDAAKSGIPVSVSSVTTTSNNVLVTIGEWISVNLFRLPASIETGIAGISTTPYLVIGAVSIGILALVAITLFIVFIGV